MVGGSGKFLREKHSMDRHRCRPELSERSGSHWYILISGKIRMDQWPLPCFQGNWYGPMALKVRQKFPRETGIGPWMALPNSENSRRLWSEIPCWKGFPAYLMLLENSSRICWQREMLSLPRFGGCWIIGPSGTLLDFAEREEHFTLRSQIEGSCPTRLLLGPMALLQCPVPTPPKDLEICFFLGWLREWKGDRYRRGLFTQRISRISEISLGNGRILLSFHSENPLESLNL